MPKPKILFVLADGARARFVERAADPGRFVTVQEMDERHKLQTLRSELRASPATEPSLPGGHALSQQDVLRSAKEAFAAEVAHKATALVAKRAYTGVFLAAPARLVGILRHGLAGKATIIG